MSRRRIVVTGATGFLGGALARSLVRRGDVVTGSGRDAARGEALARAGITFARADLTGRGTDARLLVGNAPDAVIHCAGLAVRWAGRDAFFAANVAATRRLVEASARGRCKHFILISSPTVYAGFADREGVREDAAIGAALNDYAASKAAGEAVVRAEARRSGMPCTILRPRGIYGPGDRTLLPRLADACRRGVLPELRGGVARTDPTHVDDAVAAIGAVLDAGPPARTATFNVSGGEAVALRSIIDEVARRLRLPLRWIPTPWRAAAAQATLLESLHRATGSTKGPPLTRHEVGLLAFTQTLDISTIARSTGWRPRIAFAEGIGGILG